MVDQETEHTAPSRGIIIIPIPRPLRITNPEMTIFTVPFYAVITVPLAMGMADAIILQDFLVPFSQAQSQEGTK